MYIPYFLLLARLCIVPVLLHRFVVEIQCAITAKQCGMATDVIQCAVTAEQYGRCHANNIGTIRVHWGSKIPSVKNAIIALTVVQE